jgi:hypothetical protein
MSKRCDLWDELLDVRVSQIGEVPIAECIVLARLVGPCELDQSKPGITLITWSDGSSVRLDESDEK